MLVSGSVITWLITRLKILVCINTEVAQTTTTYHCSVRIRMTRASALNGDGLYAVKSFNVYFDTNLAHFKPVTAPVPHLKWIWKYMELDVMFC